MNESIQSEPQEPALTRQLLFFLLFWSLTCFNVLRGRGKRQKERNKETVRERKEGERKERQKRNKARENREKKEKEKELKRMKEREKGRCRK